MLRNESRISRNAPRARMGGRHQACERPCLPCHARKQAEISNNCLSRVGLKCTALPTQILRMGNVSPNRLWEHEHSAPSTVDSKKHIHDVTEGINSWAGSGMGSHRPAPMNFSRSARKCGFNCERNNSARTGSGVRGRPCGGGCYCRSQPGIHLTKGGEENTWLGRRGEVL